MITAHQILETYKASFKTSGGVYVEIFIDPDMNELQSLGDYVRFSANSCDKKVYAWNAENALHYVVRQKARLRGCGENLGYWYTGILDGTATKIGDRYVMINSDCFSNGFKNYEEEKRAGRRDNANAIMHALADVLDIDWSWVEKYIKVRGWLSDAVSSVDKAFEEVNGKRRVRA